MAPIIDASWRRSGSPEQSEQASKRFIYEKTDELFHKRQQSSTPTLSSKSPVATLPPGTTQKDQKLKIENSIGVKNQILADTGTDTGSLKIQQGQGIGQSINLSSDPSNLASDNNDNSSSPPVNAGLIAGAAIGGVLALLLVFACIFFVNRRSKKHRDMEQSTKPYPFTTQRSTVPVSVTRDVESGGRVTISQPTGFRRGPSSAFASRFGDNADRPTGPAPKQRPPALPLKDPFVDPPQAQPAYENVSLSPEREKIQTRGASNAAHNPFADPGVSLARSQSQTQSQGEPKTPGSRGQNRSMDRVRGVGAEVNRSASTRTLTNTPKPVIGLPSRPKSAARSGFSNESVV